MNRAYIIRLVKIVALACATACVLASTGTPSRDLVVLIESGVVQGAHSPEFPNLIFFRGIPYAAPPVGDLRWRPPQPPARWAGVRKADELSPACPQSDAWFRIRQRLLSQLGGDPSQARPADKTSEDCLYLNVMTPHPGSSQRLPVMFYIHGGSGTIGRGDDGGAALAASGQVVVVTINYRIGALGWLSHPALTAESEHHSSGNYGLLDQIAALQWVHRNIAQFGGDPENVTIWGHSSGGYYVGILMISPLTRGLFHRAIMQSGVPFEPQPRLHDSLGSLPSAEESGVAVARSLGAEAAEALAKLRSVPAEKLINTNMPWDTIVDGWVVTDQPLALFASGREVDIPVIVGSTEQEMANLVSFNPDLSANGYRSWIKDTLGPLADEGLRIYPAPGTGDASAEFIRAGSDLDFTAPARWLAQSMSNKKSKAYLYHSTFSFDSPGGARWGAFHGSDLALLFDAPGIPRNESGDALARAMRQYWVQFAKTGDPNVPDLPNWPGYVVATGSYLDLGETIHASRSLDPEAFNLIDQLYRSRQH